MVINLELHLYFILFALLLADTLRALNCEFRGLISLVVSDDDRMLARGRRELDNFLAIDKTKSVLYLRVSDLHCLVTQGMVSALQFCSPQVQRGGES